jgi:hypothetical protein
MGCATDPWRASHAWFQHLSSHGIALPACTSHLALGLPCHQGERPLITYHLTSASAVPPIPLYLNRSTCAEVAATLPTSADRSGSPQHEPHDQPATFPAMIGWLIARLSLLQAPVVDGLDVEAPVAAHVKCRNLMLLQQLVDRGWMNVQVCGYFAHGHYFDRPPIVRRLGSIFTFHLKSLSTRANPARPTDRAFQKSERPGPRRRQPF